MHEAVIDASVVLKWIPVPKEEKVEEAWEIYQHLMKGEISVFAPTFLLIEVLNILVHKRRADESKVKDSLRMLKESNINFESLTVDDETATQRMMFQHGTTSYDSIYLALAKKKNCRLITYDSELFKIKSLTLRVEDYLQLYGN